MGGWIRVVGFRFFGAPRFTVQRSQHSYQKGLWYLSAGRPKNAKSNHPGSNPPFSGLWELISLTLTVRVKIVAGSLVSLEKLFPQNCRYHYHLEIQMNSFHCYYRYCLGVRSHPFISMDSQLPSWTSFELIFRKLLLPLPSWKLKCSWIRKVTLSNLTVHLHLHLLLTLLIVFELRM